MSDHIPASQYDIERVGELLEAGFGQLNDSLDKINGSVRQHDTSIALLQDHDQTRTDSERERRLENKVKELIKDYASPITVISGVMYLIGKSQGWW